ncbi:MAG: GNAT family N-acetyltransferase [Chloroflexi bacterium]|nr:MAG: GNAT family N-acetyltransferase [Chloroflexota bacterium]
MAMIPRLETKRLVLRPFSINDAQTVQRLAGDWVVAETMLNVPHPYEDGMAEDWISTHQLDFDEGKGVTFAIARRETDEVVGAISLRMEQFSRANMGYWIGKPYWSKGYCTEAVKAVFAFSFGELKLNKIYATYFPRNPASGRVMEKAGMHYEGYLRQHVYKAGVYEDLKLYAILRDEFGG